MDIEKREIEKLEIRARNFVDIAKDTTVNSAPQVEIARNYLAEISTAKKIVKETKEGITKPLNESLKKIREMFSRPEAMIEEAETILKNKLSVFLVKIQKEAEKKTEEVMTKVVNGEMTMAQAGAKLEKVEARADAVPKRTIKEMFITDENQIPDSYWVLDMVRLRKDVLSGVVVPGTLIVSKDIIVNR